MQLYYWREQKNFGDALNQWLWPQLLGDILDDDEQALFVGIGTLLNTSIPERPYKAVFGTGAGYGDYPRIDDRWTVYCVRGPLTAKALGLAPQAAITDGAALIRLIDLPVPTKHYPVAFMPHWESMLYWDWAKVCAAGDVHFIDPLGAPEQVIHSILRSEVVVTEAMHGAIVADALRVPWIPVRSSGQILSFKWQDWCSSLGVSYDPLVLPALYNEQVFRSVLPKRLRTRLGLQRFAKSSSLSLVLDAIGAGAGRLSKGIYDRKAAQVATMLQRSTTQRAPGLSTDDAISSVTAQLHEQLARFRADVRAGRFNAVEAQQVQYADGLASMQLDGSH